MVERLSKDLKKSFPGTTAFSTINMWSMRQLHENDTGANFLSQAVREMVIAIPWGHHDNLLAKIQQPAQRLYYLKATVRFGWSRSVLLNQIKAQACERSLAEGKSHNFPKVLPEHLAEQAEEALKSSYNLEFLGRFFKSPPTGERART